MQIVRVQIKNLLSISDVEIKPKAVNQIVGKNNMGKTTILRALQLGLEGTTDGTVVKHGEQEAEIVIEFDDQTVVHRTIRSDGKQDVVILNKNGSKTQKPQALLDSLINHNAFNPIDLLDPKNRTEALLKCIDIKVFEEDLEASIGKSSPIPLPPLDYRQHGLKVAEQAHKYFYQRRAEANKISKEKRAKWELKEKELPPSHVAPELPSKDEIQKTISNAQSIIDEEKAKGSIAEERKENLETLKRARQQNLNRKIQIEEQLRALNSELSRLDAILEGNDKAIAEAGLKIEADKPDEERIENARHLVSENETNLTIIAQYETLQEKFKTVEGFKNETFEAELFADKLNTVVTFIGKKFKENLMSKADLPVAGLTYEENQFFLDGSSIDNLSSSRAMSLAVAIARKLAGKTKIICIDGAELLDNESYESLRTEIENDGFTYFITKVGAPFDHKGDTVTTMERGMAI